MSKFLVEFGEWERHIVEGRENQYKCIKYLLRKWKEEFPYEMVHTKIVPETEEVTWPAEETVRK
jgi:hypothetical protein